MTRKLVDFESSKVRLQKFVRQRWNRLVLASLRNCVTIDRISQNFDLDRIRKRRVMTFADTDDAAHI